MRNLLSLAVMALACCVLIQPAVARMKPVAAGKVESASEKRARILKARAEAKQRKEREELEAKRQKEMAEWEAKSRQEMEEREAQRQKEREESEAYYKNLEREREEEKAREKAAEEQAQAEEEARWKKIEAEIAEAGLPEGWKHQKGIVELDELLKLTSPVVVFLRESEARRYMTWLRSDKEAAQQYALERAQEDTAFVLPKGSKVIVTQCEDEEGDITAASLFYVSSPDEVEGWASNLILRQHRVAKKKAKR